MKKIILFISIFLLLACSNDGDSTPDGDSQYSSFSPDGIPFTIAEAAWTADMQGNHRAVVQVDLNSGKAVWVELPWRRSDLRIDMKKIVVVDATSNEAIKNVLVKRISPEKGTIVFEPNSSSKEYYVYYMPYKYRKGWNDARYGKPWNDYLAPAYEADESWIGSVSKYESLSKAKVLKFESRTRFDFLTSMGVIATESEMDRIKKEYPNGPIIFTEDRAYPIRLTNQIPYRWTVNTPSLEFKGSALLNEYYVWQIGLWATRSRVENVKLQFSDLVNGSSIIKKEEITCFNQEGINWDGQPISFDVDVDKDKVQALWCGVQIPEEAKPGVYKGKVTLTANHIESQTIDVEINVENILLADKGDGDLWRHARLRWLNSKIGEDNLPTSSYKAMEVNAGKITATDKYFTVAQDGLPEKITINGREVLNSPLRFVVETDKERITFAANNAQITKEADGLVKWTASSTQNKINFNCSAYMEYDGYVRYNIKLSSSADVAVKDIRLVTEYSSYASEYFMGTGFKGGFCPTAHHWDWTGPWDSYWMGNDKAGLHVEFRGGEYHGPLLKDYKPEAPQAWANGGKGSISVKGGKHRKAEVIASTGSTTISSAEKDFEFALLITPVKKINSNKHFSERYYHADWKGFNEAAKEEPNITNIHHSQSLNPVINYPFIVRDSLIQFIQEQHKHDRKVKIYYTIRELTNYAEEIHALKSMNHEIFASGVGYGLPWHCEHLIADYKAAWYTELPNETSDAALVLSGFSRWINYYLEGLRWMLENYDLDGIYMDDVSFDRTVMKRMSKIINTYKPTALVDLHSNTGYSIGPANQYTDFFPYVDRLWFGESFKYNDMTPDEWFVTFSGIPFGQMSEMLQDGGNRFLGMVYGTTARHSYGQFSPTPVWQLWKSFGIGDAEMLGYWDERCPVSTSNPNVKATAYVKKDKVLISLGNFDTKELSVQLNINWSALGMTAGEAKLEAPEVEDFQTAQTFNLNSSIPVKGKEGWLLILSKK